MVVTHIVARSSRARRRAFEDRAAAAWVEDWLVTPILTARTYSVEVDSCEGMDPEDDPSVYVECRGCRTDLVSSNDEPFTALSLEATPCRCKGHR